MYVDRKYRDKFTSDDLVGFRLVVKDSDLMIMVDKASYFPELEKKAEGKLMYYRTLLEEYIAFDPLFKTALEPYKVLQGAPEIALQMQWAGNRCGVGPMAAVAGAVAEVMGKFLLQHVQEVLVENGGDLFMKISKPRSVGVFAGPSPLSDRIALRILPEKNPLGICTSSGTVGPSLSLGKADAVVVMAASTALADAAATATGNKVKTNKDIEEAVIFASNIEGVSGVLVIKGEAMAAWGDIELVPLKGA